MSEAVLQNETGITLPKTKGLSMFSIDVIQEITTHGWHLNRRIDTQKYIDFFEANDLYYNHYALEFLSEFGDLSIPYLVSRKPDWYAQMNFKVLKANITPENVYEEQILIGVSLCPIGEVDQGDTYFYIDEQGRFLQSTNFYTILTGNNGHEGIVNMLTGRDIITILYECADVSPSTKAHMERELIRQSTMVRIDLAQ